MQTGRSTAAPRQVLIGAALLVIGVLIGALSGPLFESEATGERPRTVGREIDVGKPTRFLPREGGGAAPPDNGLETLELTIAEDDARLLHDFRNEAVARGVIVDNEQTLVPMELVHDGRAMTGELRIKGDLPDHVMTRKVSMRLMLDDERFRGMRTFSVQAPETRGGISEWLILQVFRREGVLAPRSGFVNIVVNGNSMGVFFYEEHFGKELLESQERRDGPILAFDETPRWNAQLRSHRTRSLGGRISDLQAVVDDPDRAAVRIWQERRLNEDDTLARSLFAGLDQMEAARKLLVAASAESERLSALDALVGLEGRVVADVFDTDLLARSHALATVLLVRHSLLWHNVRFYHNPITDRLEPVMFDNLGLFPSYTSLIVRDVGLSILDFRVDPDYYARFFDYLGEYTTPEFLDELFEELGPDLARFERALRGDRALKPGGSVDDMRQLLERQQIFLRTIVDPPDALQIFGTTGRSAVGTAETADPSASDLVVEAWATTDIPVVLLGFRFENGAFVPARTVLETETSGLAFLDGGVVPPWDGRHLRFRIPRDRRISGLRDVDQIKAAIREGAQGGGPTNPELFVVYRCVSAGETREDAVFFHRFDASWEEEGGRPRLPSVADALAAHPFLVHDLATDRLSIPAGEWSVAGDLLVPRGYALTVEAGATLLFEEGAVLFTEEPLFLAGTATAPVALRPAGASFGGVVVLNAEGVSQWTHASITATSEIARGGWIQTGGVNFYRSPVVMRDVLFDGTTTEDALNVFGARIDLVRVSIRGAPSDSFDGDFVHGEVRDCVFEDGGGDGVDFSGSQVLVSGSRFTGLRDKAISAGERTKLEVVGCTVERCTIGIAAKDLSEVRARETTLRDCAHFGIAVYVKKVEFGPCRVEADGVAIEGAGMAPYLVQTGCELVLEGVSVPTEDVDVERLYREQILGN